MTIIHGIDSNQKVLPLLLDANGNIIVSTVATITNPVTVQQSIPANLLVGSYGYDGVNWQALLVDEDTKLKVSLQPHNIHDLSTVTQFTKQGAATNQTTTLYTVTAGKTGYLTSLAMCLFNTGGAFRIETLIIQDATPTTQMTWSIAAGAGAVASYPIPFATPIKLGSQWTVKVVSGVATTGMIGMVTGYEL